MPNSFKHHESVPTRRNRRRLFVLIILAFSVLVFFALDLTVGLAIGPPTQASFRTAHEYYHHALVSNDRRDTAWGGRPYPMVTNSLAMRDGSVRSVPPTSDQHRVVVIGDSMLEGLGVAYDQTVGANLAKIWSETGTEVLNAAVVSFSPKLYYLRTRHLIEEEGLRFDELLVFLDISDIQDELFYEDFSPAAPHFLGRTYHWWRSRSMLTRVLARSFLEEAQVDNRFRRDADINVWMESTRAYNASTNRDPEEGRFYWTVHKPTYEAWGKRGLQLARENLTLLHDLCKSNDVELTIVVYPSPVQLFKADIDGIQQTYWRSFCEERGIRLIDLFPTFIQPRGRPDDFYQRHYIPRDVHWNAAGHRMVAEAVAQALDQTREADEPEVSAR